jgi:hypothetical protein
MACPVASLVALGALFPPAHTLFARDRMRWIAWAALALLAAGWIAYYVALRRPSVRITMEIVSVVLLVAAGLRIRVLARRDGNAAAWLRAWRDAGRRGWQLLRSPWVLAAKLVLLTMLVLEWSGRADFSATQFGLAILALVTAVGIRIVQMRRPARFEALESLAARPVEGSCPLGFDAGRSETARP